MGMSRSRRQMYIHVHVCLHITYVPFHVQIEIEELPGAATS